MTHKMVEITWMDSKGVTSSWEFVEDLEQLRPCRVKSIGYLLEDREGYKTIVQSMSKEQVLGRLTIPVGCIKKVRDLGIEAVQQAQAQAAQPAQPAAKKPKKKEKAA